MFYIEFTLLDAVLTILGLIAFVWSLYFTSFTARKSKYDRERKMEDVMRSASKAIRRETELREKKTDSSIS